MTFYCAPFLGSVLVCFRQSELPVNDACVRNPVDNVENAEILTWLCLSKTIYSSGEFTNLTLLETGGLQNYEVVPGKDITIINFYLFIMRGYLLT